MINSIIVTNNKLLFDKYKDSLEVDYIEDMNYLGMLCYVRDRIHEGHKLLTHPLSGSIKPNETPYKSIIISKIKQDLDEEGLIIIEESILTTKKFLGNKTTPNWTDRVLNDFMVIDLSLMENIIDKLER